MHWIIYNYMTIWTLNNIACESFIFYRRILLSLYKHWRAIFFYYPMLCWEAPLSSQSPVRNARICCCSRFLIVWQASPKYDLEKRCNVFFLYTTLDYYSARILSFKWVRDLLIVEAGVCSACIIILVIYAHVLFYVLCITLMFVIFNWPDQRKLLFWLQKQNCM